MKTADFTTRFPVVDARAVYLDPSWGIIDYLFTVEGPTAYAVERAERASFYGIHSTTRPEAGTAHRLICDAVTAFLDANGIDYYGYRIMDAHSVNTDGTPTPYRAEVYIRVDV